MVDFRVSVVLPAAGCGSRMSLDVPKQFIRVFDRPVVSYTIEAFESIPWIENIVVVSPLVDNQRKLLESVILEFNHKKVVISPGGSTRHRSIFNGVQHLNTPEQKPDVVVIHDAVRPFVKEELLKNLVVSARKHGASGVVRPLVSTVIARNEELCLDHSLDRSKYVGSEMPQAFNYDVILNAYEKCTEEEFDHGTECLQLALKYSQTRALLLDGPDYLWKVTHKKDLFAFEGLLKENHRQCVQLKRRNNGLSYLETTVKKEFIAKGRKVVGEDFEEGCKPNILVNFDFLNQTGQKGKTVDNKLDEIILEGIQQHGILVLVSGGTSEDFKQLQIVTQNIASRGKKARITCGAVWCNDIITTEEKPTTISLDNIAKMIVNVALELPPCFSGQIFTVPNTT